MGERNQCPKCPLLLLTSNKEPVMNNVIYIVGLVVVVLAVLSFFGLR
jgi:hypothetical protein